MRGAALALALLVGGCFDFASLSNGGGIGGDGGLDLAVTDDGGDDGGADLGPAEPPTCPGTAYGCQPFEATVATPWQIEHGSNDTATVTANAARTGQGGMHAHTGGGTSQYARVLYFPQTMIASGLFTLRFWVRAPTATLPAYTLFGMVLTATHTESIGVDRNGRVGLTIDSTTDFYPLPVTLQANRWTCLELRLDYDAQNVTLLVDGATVIDKLATPLDTLVQAQAGLARGDPTVATDVDLDDVAVGFGALGCQ